jgi:hypothetical protein
MEIQKNGGLRILSGNAPLLTANATQNISRNNLLDRDYLNIGVRVIDRNGRIGTITDINGDTVAVTTVNMPQIGGGGGNFEQIHVANNFTGHRWEINNGMLLQNNTDYHVVVNNNMGNGTFSRVIASFNTGALPMPESGGHNFWFGDKADTTNFSLHFSRNSGTRLWHVGFDFSRARDIHIFQRR